MEGDVAHRNRLFEAERTTCCERESTVEIQYEDTEVRGHPPDPTQHAANPGASRFKSNSVQDYLNHLYTIYSTHSNEVPL